MKLSRIFEKALQYAASIHSEQKRKGTEIPYVSHLLGVASIALESGQMKQKRLALYFTMQVKMPVDNLELMIFEFDLVMP